MLRTWWVPAGWRFDVDDDADDDNDDDDDNNNNNNNNNAHNLAKTITDKQNKYQELANEIYAMWKQNTAQVIQIAVSSMAVIPQSLSRSLKKT